jgi:hypothetical protein
LRYCHRFSLESCSLTPSTETTLPTGTTAPTVTTTSTTSSTTTTLPSRLSLLLGRWAFTYTIVSTYTDHYNLATIQPATNGPYNVVVGMNLDLGNTVVAGRVQDIDPGNQTPQEFALLDPESSLLCEFFVFDLIGVSTATGDVYYLDGSCQSPIGSPLQFTGGKY